MELVLASTSPIRRTLLTNAGVRFDAERPDVDEQAIKENFTGEAAELATVLAAAKGQEVSRRRNAAMVIGSDSVVSVDGRLFSKPEDRGEAAEHLRFFSGKTMVLTSAVALACDGETLWHHAEEARLRVRALSEEFIKAYLEADWPEVAYCVGVFRMEGPGVQLFEAIAGDYFTILGLPLLPLLGALREQGFLLS